MTLRVPGRTRLHAYGPNVLPVVAADLLDIVQDRVAFAAGLGRPVPVDCAIIIRRGDQMVQYNKWSRRKGDRGDGGSA